jgi:hypothetical protein
MCRKSCTFLILMLLVPVAASALQIRWSSGTSDLRLETATRCTLLVASGDGSPLPAEWRLVWATESNALPPLLVQTEPLGGTDTARVCTVDLATSSLQALAHDLTVTFCSAGTTTGAFARYAFDIPAGTRVDCPHSSDQRS